MVIISKAALNDFVVRYPDSETAIEQWYAVAKEADWKNFMELKKSFNILFVGTHAEYDKIDAAKITFKK